MTWTHQVTKRERWRGHYNDRSDLHNDVVDWDVYEFNKVSNETHYCKTHGSRQRNLLEF